MRESILDAACRAIVERGVEAVRMRDIAAAAGVSPTLPHYYFNTRSELLREAFVHAEEAMARLELEVAGERPARERLDRLLLVYFDADPAGWRLTALVEGLGTWLLTGMATRRQCRELVRDSVARELGEQSGSDPERRPLH